MQPATSGLLGAECAGDRSVSTLTFRPAPATPRVTHELASLAQASTSAANAERLWELSERLTAPRD